MSAKERICDALCRMISSGKKSYEQMTVQDIVDEAGVGRNSFYRNYTSKEDIFTERFLKVKEETDRLFMKRNDHSLHGLLYAIFETVRNNKDFFLSFYTAVPKIYFDTFVGQILQSNTSEDIRKIAPEDYYTFAGRAWITVGILTEWMQRNCDLPTETIIRIIESWNIE